MIRAALKQRANLRIGADPMKVMKGISTTGTVAPRHESGAEVTNVRRGGGLDLRSPSGGLAPVLEFGDRFVLHCACGHAALLKTWITVRSLLGWNALAAAGSARLIHADILAGPVVAMLLVYRLSALFV